MRLYRYLLSMKYFSFTLTSNHPNHDILTTAPQLSQLTTLLNDTIRIKQQVVDADFREQGLRRILNFGHTIGHAIEESYAEQGRSVQHGYCVMWGMVAELYLSVIKLGCPREALTQMSHLMIAAYGRPECNCRQVDALKQWMLKDKLTVNTEVPTSVDHIATSTSRAKKVWENGQWIIIRDNERYTILGTRL